MFVDKSRVRHPHVVCCSSRGGDGGGGAEPDNRYLVNLEGEPEMGAVEVSSSSLSKPPQVQHRHRCVDCPSSMSIVPLPSSLPWIPTLWGSSRLISFPLLTRFQ